MRTDKLSSGGFSVLLLVAMSVAVPTNSLAHQEAPPEVREIPSDGVVSSEIDAADPFQEGRRFEEFSLTLTRGEVVQIDMEAVMTRDPGANVIDSYLALFRPGRRMVVASNNDRAEGSTNARIYYRATANGIYTLRASGSQFASDSPPENPAAGNTGRYRLSITRLSTASEPRPLGAEPIEDTFKQQSAVTVYSGSAFHEQLYTFTAEPGERVRVEMTSTDFISSLQLSDQTGRVRYTASSEDEGGPTARITTIVGPSGGTFTAHAQAPIARSGRYTIALMRLPAPPAEPVRQIAVGSVTDASLDEATSAAATEEGVGLSYLYRDYTLRLNQNEAVTLMLSSTDFDPVLQAGGMSIFGFAPVFTNDDSGGTLNSRLVLRPARPGIAHIRVRSLGTAGGSYQLKIERGEIAEPVAAADLE